MAEEGEEERRWRRMEGEEVMVEGDGEMRGLNEVRRMKSGGTGWLKVGSGEKDKGAENRSC